MPCGQRGAPAQTLTSSARVEMKKRNLANRVCVSVCRGTEAEEDVRVPLDLSFRHSGTSVLRDPVQAVAGHHGSSRWTCCREGKLNPILSVTLLHAGYARPWDACTTSSSCRTEHSGGQTHQVRESKVPKSLKGEGGRVGICS